MARSEPIWQTTLRAVWRVYQKHEQDAIKRKEVVKKLKSWGINIKNDQGVNQCKMKGLLLTAIDNSRRGEWILTPAGISFCAENF